MRLFVTRRTVPLDRIDVYLELWARLKTAAEGLGCRAWLFRAAAREDRFLEFLEEPAGGPALDDATISDARAELRDRFPPEADDEWTEAPLEVQP